MRLGMTELLLIAGIVLLLFGGSKLPALGDGIGKAIRNLKKGLDSGNDEAKPPRIDEGDVERIHSSRDQSKDRDA